MFFGQPRCPHASSAAQPSHAAGAAVDPDGPDEVVGTCSMEPVVGDIFIVALEVEASSLALPRPDRGTRPGRDLAGN
ncbi:hypothetical protein [Nannocystis pusilla]|uniref:Uncharacterized protein n=1 Tax=Nannocystis pusilla TaxID=889268 RepID=A0ABS7TTH5_9BACT|nr:hypothetical protein [Nannocystis pusilla]MBZ5711540.1 hypothetical protein [Nannocystis pusilla]